MRRAIERPLALSVCTASAISVERRFGTLHVGIGRAVTPGQGLESRTPHWRLCRHDQAGRWAVVEEHCVPRRCAAQGPAPSPDDRMATTERCACALQTRKQLVFHFGEACPQSVDSRGAESASDRGGHGRLRPRGGRSPARGTQSLQVHRRELASGTPSRRAETTPLAASPATKPIRCVQWATRSSDAATAPSRTEGARCLREPEAQEAACAPGNRVVRARQGSPPSRRSRPRPRPRASPVRSVTTPPASPEKKWDHDASAADPSVPLDAAADEAKASTTLPSRCAATGVQKHRAQQAPPLPGSDEMDDAGPHGSSSLTGASSRRDPRRDHRANMADVRHDERPSSTGVAVLFWLRVGTRSFPGRGGTLLSRRLPECSSGARRDLSE